MNSICLKANGKINLSLDILGKREDGYHQVKMIMQSVALHDEVIIEVVDEGINVSCDKHWVPSGSNNIAYKAAKLLMDKCHITKGVKIKIIKKIPVAAGLAGGSADAAAVIRGINKLFGINVSEEELMKIGKQVGADIPFCIKGGTMLAEGIGEVLSPINPFCNVPIVLVKPKISVSTAWVYNNLELKKIVNRPDTDLLMKAIANKDNRYVAKNMLNVLETVTAEKWQVIQEIKEDLIKLGALGSMMSGSGPTVFGIFESHKEAQDAYNTINSGKWECFFTETIS